VSKLFQKNRLYRISERGKRQNRRGRRQYINVRREKTGVDKSRFGSKPKLSLKIRGGNGLLGWGCTAGKPEGGRAVGSIPRTNLAKEHQLGRRVGGGGAEERFKDMCSISQAGRKTMDSETGGKQVFSC